MKIKLAGYNVDIEILEKLNKNKKEILTPETFSAAYARISRSSKDVTSLRKQAKKDIEKARKSNKTIIFKMGHHSVAEHAVFNFDIIGVSRLAIEEVEKFRLSTYTEKSQRYVTLDGDYITPVEIQDKNSIKLFKDTINIQNEFYKKSLSTLKEYVFNKHKKLSEIKKNKTLLEGWAKEDARYILSLATEGQLGLTINARNLEHLLRRFALSKQLELKEIGEKIYSIVKKIAPSIILFPEPSDFEKDLNFSFKNNFQLNNIDKLSPVNIEPEIIRYTPDGDNTILASFLSIYKHINYNDAYNIIENMKKREKENIFKDLFKNIEFFDSPSREFEFPDITFQAIVSASNFAQLKRHRMATLISGNYDLKLGNTIPESIKINGLEKEFMNIIEKTNKVYFKLKEKHNKAADYILTNSHRRMVMMKMNLREIYHFVRLRDDEHAQWDIRELANKISYKIKEIMPLSSMFLCGKSDFVKRYERIYNTKPKEII